MSPYAARLFVLLLATTPLSALAADYVGINGSSCEFSSVQDALDDPSQPSTIWIAEGVHSDPGFVVERDLTAKRGDSSCATGGSDYAVLDFGNGGRAELESDLRVDLTNITLANGVGGTGGNLLVGADTIATLTDVNLLGGSATQGGGVAVSAGATLDVRGGTFWLNDATGAGGAIHAASGAEVELSSGLGVDLIFLSNDAASGGAVMCDDCALVVDAPYGYDVTFSYNDAEDEGGAISAVGGDVSIIEASFLHNEASDGGAVSLDGSAVSGFSYLDFSENAASDDGGALFVFQVESFVLDYVDFIDNVAGDSGGAVFASDSDFDADHGLWDANVATSGGGLTLSASSGTFTPRVRHSTLRDNEATGGTTGSAIDVRGSSHTFTLSNSQVIGGLNGTAPGAAIVAQTGADLDLKDITVADNQRWGVATLTGSTATISGSIVWGNGSGGVTGTGTGTCSDIQGITPSGSLISADPQFVDPATDDYTIASTSPAWDACAPHAGTALNGVSRASGASDMGAYDH